MSNDIFTGLGDIIGWPPADAYTQGHDAGFLDAKVEWVNSEQCCLDCYRQYHRGAVPADIERAYRQAKWKAIDWDKIMMTRRLRKLWKGPL